MKRLAQITITIFATLLGFVLLWSFRPALELFGGSLALSSMLRPLVKRLEERGMQRGWAILLWYVLLLVLVAGLVFVFGLGISGDIASAIEGFPQWYANLQTWLTQFGLVGQTLGNALPDLSAADGGLASIIGGTALGLLGGAVGQIVLLLAMLSLAFYWLSEVSHFERLWLSLLPVTTRVRARELWRNAETAVGAYIRSTLVAIMLASLLLLALFSFVNWLPNFDTIPFATLLALLGGVAHLVPGIGPALALVFIVAVVATVSPLAAVIVLAAGVVIQVAVHQVAARMMAAHTGRVNPLLQVLLLLALGEIGGLAGLIFAPPLAALVQVLNDNLRLIGTETVSEERALVRLEERLRVIEERADPEQKEFMSALRRSKDLVLQARKLVD